MKNTEHVNFYGKPVPESQLKQVFEQTKESLIAVYPAAKNIKMPLIKGFVLPSKNYLQIEKQLMQSELNHVRETEAGVMQSAAGQSSASLFRTVKDNLETWVIIKREAFGYSLEDDLKQEMIHIFEKVMLMPEGSLTVSNEQ